jgi:heme/copper-type cytochrome/quinol oxidase subunit 2
MPVRAPTLLPALLATQRFGMFRFAFVLAVVFLTVLATMMLIGGWRHRRDAGRKDGPPRD